MPPLPGELLGERVGASRGVVPRDEQLERCADDTGFLSATWIGDGTADGAASLMCMSTAMSAGDYFGCVTNRIGYGKCLSQCTGAGADPAVCQTCLDTECDAAKTAMTNAKCQ